MQGMVMDIKGNRAIVFQKDGKIIEVKNHNYKVGQSITLHSYSYKKYLQMVACLILCCFIGFGGYTAYGIPASYIYVDINPSLRLDLNCFGKVVAVNPLNEDATKLMEEYKFNSSSAEECISEIVTACKESKYLNDENNDIELDVVTSRKSINENVSKVSEKLKKDNLVVNVTKTNKKDNEKALSLKTSPKRLKAIEEYTNAYGGTIDENTTELRDMSVKEIYSEVEKEVKVELKDTRIENTKSENRNKNEPNLKPSSKRLNAIERYTEKFGGTVKENTLILKEFSVKEINNSINSNVALR